MAFLTGKRGLLIAAAVAGSVVYWRVRQTRIREDLEWREEIPLATKEGQEAGRAFAESSDDV